jgi:hypothetical protein
MGQACLQKCAMPLAKTTEKISIQPSGPIQLQEIRRRHSTIGARADIGGIRFNHPAIAALFNPTKA